MTVDTTKLPLTYADFKELREDGCVYVDKTRMIYQLARKKAPVFLSRPRRFGKSLLVSTFESLFSKGLKDFKGLDIEKLWKDDKTYQVMKFDFSRMPSSSAEGFKKSFMKWIKETAKPFGFTSEETDYDAFIIEFDFWLQRQPHQKYVLLIDEYDNPLTGFLDKPEDFETTLAALSSFYATIKGCGGAFKFVFITGIAKFQKASIFSKMNTIDDISLNPNYGTLTGYTQEELEKYFGPYIDNAAKALEMSRAELLERMKEQYDGFCFDDAARYRLYAPWSVLKFLSEPENGFKNYWSQTGGSPTLILDYFSGHSIESPEDFMRDQSVTKIELTDPASLDTMNPLVLLTQAGYYTIDYAKGDDFYLRYPNGEVEETMAKRYKDVLYKNHRADAKELGIVVDAMESGDPEEMFKACNTVILKFPSAGNFALKNEELVRGFLMFIFLTQEIQAIPEKLNALGRADLVVTHKDQCVVFEFKYCYDGDGHPKESADALLKEAVKQMIEKKYGLEITGKKVLRLAMVFSQKERSFVRWQKVELDATL